MPLYLESVAFVYQGLLNSKFDVFLISLDQLHQLLYKRIFLSWSERDVRVSQLTVFS